MKHEKQCSAIWDLVPNDIIIDLDKPVERIYWTEREHIEILLAINELEPEDRTIVKTYLFDDKIFKFDIINPLLELLKPKIVERVSKIEELKYKIEDIVNESSL